ncbi:hypothetical protein C8F04DRAFT_1279932 [Mycena alexandri]|uniref:Uncharacterized protein n=1 Tax=Mycena alexandri TaxID=1745969 RepID=A0AAD6WLP5_9AGAR|nr:hypothetical protein C8F04DRAFT_1279932 [Mycena alexandri]
MLSAPARPHTAAWSCLFLVPLLCSLLPPPFAPRPRPAALRFPACSLLSLSVSALAPAPSPCLLPLRLLPPLPLRPRLLPPPLAPVLPARPLGHAFHGTSRNPVAPAPSPFPVRALTPSAARHRPAAAVFHAVRRAYSFKRLLFGHSIPRIPGRSAFLFLCHLCSSFYYSSATQSLT